MPQGELSTVAGAPSPVFCSHPDLGTGNGTMDDLSLQNQLDPRSNPTSPPRDSALPAGRTSQGLEMPLMGDHSALWPCFLRSTSGSQHSAHLPQSSQADGRPRVWEPLQPLSQPVPHAAHIPEYSCNLSCNPEFGKAPRGVGEKGRS